MLNRFVTLNLFFISAFFLTPSAIGHAAECPATFGHIASKLPVAPAPELQKIRNEILSSSTDAMMQKVIDAGFSKKEAARVSLQQAQEIGNNLTKNERCILASAQDGGKTVARLKKGDFSFLDGKMGGQAAACAHAWAAAYYGYQVSKEAAIILACLASK